MPEADKKQFLGWIYVTEIRETILSISPIKHEVGFAIRSVTNLESKDVTHHKKGADLLFRLFKPGGGCEATTAGPTANTTKHFRYCRCPYINPNHRSACGLEQDKCLALKQAKQRSVAALREMEFRERLFIASIIISYVDEMGALLNNKEIETYVMPTGAVVNLAPLIKQDIEAIEVFLQEYLSEEAKIAKAQGLHKVYYSPEKEQQQGRAV
ncbi:hypothetical protein RLOatenuis_1440 [Rickettsiales bacterium]|nr:hypothetical protein RLOatenuis_1440 [Rickettsiales bacterium]